MKKYFLLIVFCSISTTVNTQQLISAQHHWDIFSKTEHTHVECDKNILYKTYTSPVVVTCQFQLFHVDGKISLVTSNMGAVIWDATNAWSWTPPNNIGNPIGIVIIKAKFIIDSQYNNGTFPLHGWGNVTLVARTEFDDGSRIDTTLYIPMYSMIDSSSPEVPFGGDGNGVLRAECADISAPGDAGGWGALRSEFRTKIPLDPLAPGTVLNPEMVLYNYAGVDRFTNSVDRRLDPDLHNGIPGSLVTSAASFDTTGISSGDHKFSFIWTQATIDHKDSCLLVIPFTISGTVTDVCPNIAGVQTEVPSGMILNNGQCVIPPTPVIWDTGTLWWTIINNIIQYRVCPGLNPEDSRCQNK